MRTIAYVNILVVFLFMFPLDRADALENSDSYEQKIREIDQKILELGKLKQDLLSLKASLEEKDKSLSEREKTIEAREKSEAKSAKVQTATEKSPDVKWHLAGYADVGFEAISGGNDSFLSGKFNPAFHFQFKDWLIFESELEVETSDDGETEIAVEYSQLDLLLHDNLTLVVGKYLSPIGQFQERLHPSWINRSVNAPAGFGHGGVQPASDVGFQLRGGLPVDDFIVTYALAIGNGPRFGHEEGELELEGFGEDSDGNKAIGGRLALVHKSSLEFGVSYLDAGLYQEAGLAADGDLLPELNGDYRLWGVDAAYSKGSWDIRFEYLNAKLTPARYMVLEEDEEGHGSGLEETNWESWYAQLAYRLSGITDDRFIGKFEPVVRYGEFRVKIDGQYLENSEKRLNAGLNYWLSPTVVVKTGLEKRNYFVESRLDETRYKLQLSYGF